MRIYSMTATFGKLEHETLTLKPGLNIIEAPNEWGKSTWCAFLTAMLYGLDTRAKTTKTALADKERYAPWSGSPMSGRIDLNWNGRDITIERRTVRRVPLGEFKAYETNTGLPVPELTAANCGQMLLGVEQTVFRRAGFIRFSDLPVTQDEALRRRLNALVTTGDESGAADRLGQELKELKNRIRYNRSGLLPQAEVQLEEVEGKLRELEHLTQQSRKLRQRLDEQKQWQRQLENHRKALAFAASRLDAQRIAQARDAREAGLQRLTRLEHATANLPSREAAEDQLRQLRAFREEWNAAQAEAWLLPELTQAPEIPEPFQNKALSQAEDMLGADLRRYELLTRTKPWLLWLIFGGALLVLAALAAGDWGLTALCLALPGLVLTVLGLYHRQKWRTEAAVLVKKYGSEEPEHWTRMLADAKAARERYEAAAKERIALRSNLHARLARLEEKRAALCGDGQPEQMMEYLQQIIRQWAEYHDALRDQARLDRHLQDLQTMARTAQMPEMADTLDYSEEKTRILLNEAIAEQQRLLSRLGQYQGQIEALGNAQELKQQHSALCQRIKELEERYAALTIAQETLLEARQELQRRFAPRIAKRAQALLARLTEGRYQRLTLGSDFQLQAAAEGEDTLQDAWWRSDGTVDQLYLALRLAVAGELTPGAPLLLDDALVRFDDKRLKAALDILQQEAKDKQVLLFTCQGRERALLKE